MTEKFRIIKPDIPVGDAGIAKTVELVNKALLDMILPLQQRQERLLKAAQIHPATLPEMVKMEEEDKPMEEILLTGALLLAGVPEDYLRSLCYEVSSDSPFYVKDQFSQNPQLYFSDELLAKFSSDDPDQRFQASLKLGRPLTQINLNLAADILDVPSNLKGHTKLLMKDSLDYILLGRMKVKFEGEVDPRKIDDTSDMIKSLMDYETSTEQPRFVAIGGAIKLILPGQTLVTSEYQMGTDFHVNVYCFIGHPAVQQYLDDLAIYNKGFVKVTFPSDVTKRALGIKPLLGMLEVGERKVAADCFLHSELLFQYMQSDNPKINPYKALA